MSAYNVAQCQRIQRSDGKSCVIAIVQTNDDRILLVRQTLDETGEYSWDQVVMYRVRVSDTLDSLLPDIDRFFDEVDAKNRMMVSSARLKADLIAATKHLAGHQRSGD